MDFARIHNSEKLISATDFVRDYSNVLAPFAYNVAKLPEIDRPRCTVCDNPVHLYDIKNLQLGITRHRKKKVRANPGFHHYESIPECPNSYANDKRFADFVSNSLFDKDEAPFNKEVLSSVKVRKGIDLVTAYFMYPYSGNREISLADERILKKLETTFITPMKGIGNNPWLVPFLLMSLLPDRERNFLSGTTATVGFRVGNAKMKMTLIDSKGVEHEKYMPRFITLGYITKREGGRDINPMLWMGDVHQYEVSRPSALKLWEKGKKNEQRCNFNSQIKFGLR